VASAKVTVTIDAQLLREVDRWVQEREFPSRSQAVQSALRRLEAERGKRSTLPAELGNLDLREERTLADEVLSAGEPWPEYSMD
jgi:Arc/MetJ-type ribon-helix-helix transcriptional regulator